MDEDVNRDQRRHKSITFGCGGGNGSVVFYYAWKKEHIEPDNFQNCYEVNKENQIINTACVVDMHNEHTSNV